MCEPPLVVRSDPTPEEIDFLEDRLYAFNREATGIHDGLGLAVFVGEPPIAGLCGSSWGGCCEIRQLWVHSAHRRQGIGRRMLEAAEAEAARRGCQQVILTTHAFQAPGFYGKQGYETLFSLPDYPRGHAWILLRKLLAGGGGS